MAEAMADETRDSLPKLVCVSKVARLDEAGMVSGD